MEFLSTEEDSDNYLLEENFVLVEWNDEQFPGIAVHVPEEGAVVECMGRTNKSLEMA